MKQISNTFSSFFPLFFPSALLLSSLFLSFLWIPQCQLFPSSDRRDSFILQYTCSPSVSERHTHTAIAENTVKVIHTVGQRARMGAGVKTGQNVSTHFCTTRTPTEKEAEPSTGKEARVPEREGPRHRGLPRGPVLSQADQWLRPGGWGLQTGPPFPGLERLLSRGWPVLLLPCWQSRQEAKLGFATGPSWVPDPVHVRLFPKLFYIFLLILSTAVQLPTPFTLTMLSATRCPPLK